MQSIPGGPATGQEKIMSDFDLVVRGNIVEADRIVHDGWVAVSAGKVVARGEGAAPQARDAVDARGTWVIPGVLDGQVHSGSQAHPERLGWASRAAPAAVHPTLHGLPHHKQP